MPEVWLIDKSALTWMPRSPDRDEWKYRIQQGRVRIASVSLLEIGYSARSGPDLRVLMSTPPVSLLRTEYLTSTVEDRSREVQQLLADRGHHRAPSVPDLLIAATAEKAGLTVLHIDKDFELIAEVTGQPVERLTLPS